MLSVFSLRGAVVEFTESLPSAFHQRSPWDVFTLGLTTFCLLGLTFLFFRALYNIYLHPCAKYPGPFWARFTDLYAGYHAWKGDIHLDQWRCHLKYGEKVRYAPNRLLVNNITGLRNIYTQGQGYLKHENYAVMAHQTTNTLTCRDRKDHARRRRVVQQGLSHASLRDFEPTMYEIIHRFCDRLLCTVEEANDTGKNDLKEILSGHRWGSVRNMSHWSNYLAFDLMMSFTFDEKYKLLERKDYRYVPACFAELNVRVATLLQTPSLRWFRIDKLLFPRAIAARNIFLNFVGKLLRDAERSKSYERKDVFTKLSRTVDPETGEGFTHTEILAESITLIIAGAETTATVMASFLFYLSHYPDVYARVVAEVRSTFTNVGDIKDGAQLNSCRYLRACIDETMRMTPPVGQALFREVPVGGAVIDGDFVPGGVTVGVPIYAIHHHEAYYSDPFTFNPDRWMIHRESVDQRGGDQYAAYNPFSVGPRACIGKGLALLEMMATSAILLFRMDLKLAESDSSGSDPKAEYGRHRPNEFQLKDRITARRDGPDLQFRTRPLEQSM